jgi:hypothetical protein
VELLEPRILQALYVDSGFIGASTGLHGSPGNPFRSIEAAVDVATPGERVLVETGNGYSEADTIDISRLTIEADAGHVPVLDDTGLSGAGFTVEVGGVTISGLTINHFATGVLVAGDDSLTLSGDNVTSNAIGGGNDNHGTLTLTDRSSANNSADYGGGSYVSSTGTPSGGQTANQDLTKISHASASNFPAGVGEVVLTAAVASTAAVNGTVNASVSSGDGSTTPETGSLNGTGAASFTSTALQLSVAIGQSIIADYGGGRVFTNSTPIVLSQTADAVGTTPAVTSATNPSVYGQPVTLTATVTGVSPGGGKPAGTATFSAGGTTMGTATVNTRGVATCTVSGSQLGAGIGQSFTAAYAPDGNSAGSSGGLSGGQTVQQDATITTIASSVNRSVYRRSARFTTTVSATSSGSGTPTGVVTFKDGSTSLGTRTLNGGVASFTTSSLAAGAHSITAVYGGDANFHKSTSKVVLRVVNRRRPGLRRRTNSFYLSSMKR